MKKTVKYLLLFSMMLLFACTFSVQAKEASSVSGLEYERSMELSYAEEFSVDYYKGGYALITIADSDKFLIVPEGKEAPENREENIAVLKQPLNNIYLVATSAMDFFVSLDGLESIRLSGTNENGWYIEEAKKALKDGSILFAGKYNAPDYELILGENCSLAVESTMIYHTPEVKEKLEQFKIPVLVERSSYESHPLGRTEWIKLYGVLLGKRRKQNGFLRNRKNEWKQFFQKKTQEKQWHFSILPQMVWQMYENQMITFLK